MIRTIRWQRFWPALAPLLALGCQAAPVDGDPGEQPEAREFLSSARFQELSEKLRSGDAFRATEAATLLFEAHHDPQVMELIDLVLAAGAPVEAVDALLQSIAGSNADKGLTHLGGIVGYLETQGPLASRAREALRALPMTGALSTLRRLLGEARDTPNQRRRIALAYGVLGHLKPAQDGTLIALVDPDTESDVSVRKAAAEALESVTLFQHGAQVKHWRDWQQRYGALSSPEYMSIMVRELQNRLRDTDSAYQRIMIDLLQPDNVAQNLSILKKTSAPLSVRQEAMKNLRALLAKEGALTTEQRREISAAFALLIAEGDSAIREAAARTLGNLKERAQLTVLTEQLGKEGDAAVVSALTDACYGVIVDFKPLPLTDEDRATLLALTTALTRQLERAEPFEKNSERARALITTLGVAGRLLVDDRALVDALIERLIMSARKTENADVLSAVFAAIAEVLTGDNASASWQRAGQWLLEVARDAQRSGLARQHALVALGRIRYGPARAVLVELLDDPNLSQSLQGAIVVALGELGELGTDGKIEDKLFALYRQGDPLRTQVVQALATILGKRVHRAADIVEKMHKLGLATGKADAFTLATAAMDAVEKNRALLDTEQAGRLRRLQVTLALDQPQWENALPLLEKAISEPKVYDAELLRQMIRQAYNGSGTPARGPRVLSKVQALLDGQTSPVVAAPDLWTEAETALKALRETSDMDRYTRLLVHTSLRVTRLPPGVKAPGAEEIRALDAPRRDLALATLAEMLTTTDGSVVAQAKAMLAAAAPSPAPSAISQRLVALLDSDLEATGTAAYALLVQFHPGKNLVLSAEKPLTNTYQWHADSQERRKKADIVRELLAMRR